MIYQRSKGRESYPVLTFIIRCSIIKKKNGVVFLSLKIYNKLVRDNIPTIIEENGQTCNIAILDDEEYIKKIDEKLNEELCEYYGDGSIQELADLLEVVYAAAKARGYTEQQLEQIRLEKLEKRGGFDKRLLLISVSDD